LSDIASHAGVNDWGVLGCCRRDVADPGQRIELGNHLVDRVLRQVRVLCDDHRVRLAGVVDFVATEDRPASGLHALGTPILQPALDLWQVVGRPGGEDALHGPRRRRVDGANSRVRQRRAAESDMNEAVERDVSRVASLARDEPLIFDSAHAPADVWSHRSYNKSFTLAHSAEGG
jgi:hypothetical protein